MAVPALVTILSAFTASAPALTPVTNLEISLISSAALNTPIETAAEARIATKVLTALTAWVKSKFWINSNAASAMSDNAGLICS